MFCDAQGERPSTRIIPFGMPDAETAVVRLIGWAARKQKGQGYSVWGCWGGVIHLVAKSVADEERAKLTVRSWAEGRIAQVRRNGQPTLNGASWLIRLVKADGTPMPPMPPTEDDTPY